MTFVIFAGPDDEEAILVDHYMRAHDVDSRHLSWSDFPSQVCLSFEDGACICDHGGWPADASGIRAAWLCRHLHPVPPDGMHPNDVYLMRQSCESAVAAFYALLPTHITQLNEHASAVRVGNKITQLTLARACGFRTPKTIVTNDPRRARAFVSRQPSIVKPLHYSSWKLANDARVLSYTSRITIDQLSEDKQVQYCPMIFQEEIVKKYEYRVVVFGEDIIVVRLDSQRFERTTLDWRADSGAIGLKEVPCPPGLRSRILRLMSATGLRMASLDLAELENGDLVFFEVNEQGMLLWLEESNPDIRIFDRLMRFFMAEIGRSDIMVGRRPLSFRDFSDLIASDVLAGIRRTRRLPEHTGLMHE